MARLELRDIHKHFGGVRALRGVSFEVHGGEVHALVGENGAGKSTLIKVLAGVHAPDRGEIALDGRRVTLRHPGDAAALGVAVIYQELVQYPDLSVLENLFVGAQDVRGPFGLIDWRRLRRRGGEVFERLELDIDLDTPVGQLSTAQGQLIEIARALTRDVRFVVMDEPTASLTEQDTDVLHRVTRRLRDAGVGIVYISHRLEEIFDVADRVTVLRDGSSVGCEDVANVDQDSLITMMVGRELSDLYPALPPVEGDVLLEVRAVTRVGVLDRVSLDVRAGEIVGLAGLVGAGRSELARCIFGIDPVDDGHIVLAGRPVPRTPWGAMDAGVAYVSEDRKLDGLVLPMSIRDNVALPSLERLERGGVFDREAAARLAQRFFDALGVRAPGIDTAVAELSGGNQQKVSLARWLAREPRLLILDEPTRGIDVGAKAEIHHLMTELCRRGLAILMISSDLPEVMGMSHRIVVMRGGRVRGELSGPEATQEAVMALAATDEPAGGRAAA